MDLENKSKNMKSSLLKKLERYLSLDRGSKSPSSATRPVIARSMSCQNDEKASFSTPNGCFSVYVGPEHQRFVIKTKHANHPLFKMLLADAELEYGFNCSRPLQLPCEVDLFCRVLAEMECPVDEIEHGKCGPSYGSCSPFRNPARRLANCEMAKGHSSSYALLTPPRWLKTNHF